ncbi:MAG: hypothetical protein WBF90_02120 [Rivularia sp. (in: cyanobacteria)]
MRNTKGHFIKGNKEGFTTDRVEPLTAQIGIRLTEGEKQALTNIPNWKRRLRGFIQNMIEDDSN